MSQARLITIMIVAMITTVGLAAAVNWGITNSLIASGAFVGATGAQGEPGQDGATGAQGEQGIQGIQGAQGQPGGTGARGFTGTGATGAQGAVGPSGAPGENATAEPIVVTLGAGTHTFTTVGSYTLASIPLDPGVYAVSFTLNGVSSVTQGATMSAMSCVMSTSGAAQGFWQYSFQATADHALSAVSSLASAGTLTARCSLGDYDDIATIADLNWTGGVLTAVRLD